VSYNQSASAAYARLVAQGLKAEGYKVVTEQVDFALPNFRAAAADLKEQGADLVFDAIDTHGNAQLCEAMDDVGADVIAKVTNVQNWTSTVPRGLQGLPALPQRAVGDRFEPQLRRHGPGGRTGVPGRDEEPEDAFPVAVGGLGGRDVVHGRGEVLRENGRHARVRRPLHDTGETTPPTACCFPSGSSACRTPEDPQDLPLGGPLGGRPRMGPSQGDMNDECFDVPQLSYKP
jgi:hypothetical protein